MQNTQQLKEAIEKGLQNKYSKIPFGEQHYKMDASILFETIVKSLPENIKAADYTSLVINSPLPIDAVEGFIQPVILENDGEYLYEVAPTVQRFETGSTDNIASEFRRKYSDDITFQKCFSTISPYDEDPEIDADFEQDVALIRDYMYENRPSQVDRKVFLSCILSVFEKHYPGKAEVISKGLGVLGLKIMDFDKVTDMRTYQETRGAMIEVISLFADLKSSNMKPSYLRNILKDYDAVARGASTPMSAELLDRDIDQNLRLALIPSDETIESDSLATYSLPKMEDDMQEAYESIKKYVDAAVANQENYMAKSKAFNDKIIEKATATYNRICIDPDVTSDDAEEYANNVAKLMVDIQSKLYPESISDENKQITEYADSIKGIYNLKQFNALYNAYTKRLKNNDSDFFVFDLADFYKLLLADLSRIASANRKDVLKILESAKAFVAKVDKIAKARSVDIDVTQEFKTINDKIEELIACAEVANQDKAAKSPVDYTQFREALAAEILPKLTSANLNNLEDRNGFLQGVADKLQQYDDPAKDSELEIATEIDLNYLTTCNHESLLGSIALVLDEKNCALEEQALMKQLTQPQPQDFQNKPSEVQELIKPSKKDLKLYTDTVIKSEQDDISRLITESGIQRADDRGNLIEETKSISFIDDVRSLLNTGLYTGFSAEDDVASYAISLDARYSFARQWKVFSDKWQDVLDNESFKKAFINVSRKIYLDNLVKNRIYSTSDPQYDPESRFLSNVNRVLGYLGPVKVNQLVQDQVEKKHEVGSEAYNKALKNIESAMTDYKKVFLEDMENINKRNISPEKIYTPLRTSYNAALNAIQNYIPQKPRNNTVSKEALDKAAANTVFLGDDFAGIKETAILIKAKKHFPRIATQLNSIVKPYNTNYEHKDFFGKSSDQKEKAIKEIFSVICQDISACCLTATRNSRKEQANLLFQTLDEFSILDEVDKDSKELYKMSIEFPELLPELLPNEESKLDDAVEIEYEISRTPMLNDQSFTNVNKDGKEIIGLPNAEEYLNLREVIKNFMDLHNKYKYSQEYYNRLKGILIKIDVFAYKYLTDVKKDDVIMNLKNSNSERKFPDRSTILFNKTKNQVMDLWRQVSKYVERNYNSRTVYLAVKKYKANNNEYENQRKELITKLQAKAKIRAKTTVFSSLEKSDEDICKEIKDDCAELLYRFEKECGKENTSTKKSEYIAELSKQFSVQLPSLQTRIWNKLVGHPEGMLANLLKKYAPEWLQKLLIKKPLYRPCRNTSSSRKASLASLQTSVDSGAPDKNKSSPVQKPDKSIDKKPDDGTPARPGSSRG